MPKIDVLLAVYNNENYLDEQLDSLLAQTYQNFRIIARDDCSTDRSRIILEKFALKYPEKITLIKGTVNKGARGNFSHLFELAKNDYAMFCDGDDVWLPNKIQDSLTLMKLCEGRYGLDTPLLIHTDLAVVDKTLQLLHPFFSIYSNLNPIAGAALNRLLPQNVITGCTMLINQSLIRRVCCIPEQAIMHDWWIALIASIFGRIHFLPKATLLYRQHGKNDTGAKNWRSWKSQWLAAKKALLPSERIVLHQRFQKTIEQARQLLCCYDAQLPAEVKKTLTAYCLLDRLGPIQKRWIFLRKRFFKQGIMKNIGMFSIL